MDNCLWGQFFVQRTSQDVHKFFIIVHRTKFIDYDALELLVLGPGPRSSVRRSSVRRSSVRRSSDLSSEDLSKNRAFASLFSLKQVSQIVTLAVTQMRAFEI
jgi:hypothetical protein